MVAWEANGFVRSTCRQWLLERIRDQAPSAAAVLRNEPREILDQSIYLGDTTGTVDYPVFAPNLPRQDDFTVIVVCEAFYAADDAGEAEARCEALAQAVMDAVSANPQDTLEINGSIDVTISNVDGPDPVPTPEGYGAVMTVAVDFRTRIVNP